MGDGEMNAGFIWEAAMSAAHFRLNNLIGIVDRNGLSLDGPIEEIMALEPLVKKWEAFGWEVHEVDGNDIRALVEIFNEVPKKDSTKPTIIIARTVKGKGVSFMENSLGWHYGYLADELRDKVITELRTARTKGGT